MNPVQENINKKVYGILRRSVEGEKFSSFLDDCITHGFYKWEGLNFASVEFRKSLELKEMVTITRCKFEGLVLCGLTFKKGAVFKNCQFQKTEIENCYFNEHVKFDTCVFNENLVLQSEYENAAFQEVSFLKQVIFTGRIKHSAAFSDCSFEDKVTFKGRRIIRGVAGAIIRFPQVTIDASCSQETRKKDKAYYATIALEFLRNKREQLTELLKNVADYFIAYLEKFLKKVEYEFSTTDDSEVSRLFEGRTNFHKVAFNQPELVHFLSVDLNKATFTETSLRGVHFNDVNFEQPLLKRSGLYAETCLLDTPTRVDKLHVLPKLESAYRSMRVVLEDSKDFVVASDFFIGEMNAKRQQLPFLKRCFFSIEAFFCASSNYGQSPKRAALVLLGLVALHFVVSFLMLEVDTLDRFSHQLKLTLEVVTLQKPQEIKINWLNIMNSIFRVLIPIQAALLVLSLRSRYKRF